MSALIQAQGLHTYYGESHILHGVDLRIEAGESIGLLGRNGMGKSTLIRTILGHVAPASGNISVRGKNCTRAAPYQVSRLGIAYVPEGRGIFPNLNVRENLLVAARPGFEGRNDWTYERVLQTFPRLTERLAHGGQQLSGGEQQMLAIGRALMTNPDVLILDEATEGLAPLIHENPALAEFLARHEGWGQVLQLLAARHPAIHAALPALPRGILHGDWIKRNLFFEGAEVSVALGETGGGENGW